MTQSQGQSQDLGALVRALVVAAEPLEGKFNGPGKVAFDAFKSQPDQVSTQLNSALNAIIGGQSGMNQSFSAGQSEFADNAKSSMGGADFSAASFGRSA